MISVDTSHWIARLIPRDRRHADAAVSPSTASSRLVTPTLVAAETWTFLHERAGHRRVTLWLDAILGEIAVTVERLDDEARAWHRVHDERPYSFVDATSFVLMRKLQITDALAFDGGFTAAGFDERRP